MKKFALLSFPIFFLMACHKNATGPENTRLLKIRSTDITGTNTTEFSFEYDQAGRIIKVLSSFNNNTPVTITDVSYAGDKMVIAYPAIHNASVDNVDAIEYKLDANNKPVQRIQNTFIEFKAPVNQPQRDFNTDTAVYEYDAAGLLIKITGKRRDSTWFNPGTVETTTDVKQYTSVYTNTGGNLEKWVKTTQKNYRRIFISLTVTNSHTITETQLFEYNRAYANKIDFTNALVLTELGLVYDLAYPLNKNYKNIPDNISFTLITKDATTGAVIESYDGVQNIVLGYNLYSLISSIDRGSGSNKIELIYNR